MPRGASGSHLPPTRARTTPMMPRKRSTKKEPLPLRFFVTGDGRADVSVCDTAPIKEGCEEFGEHGHRLFIALQFGSAESEHVIAP